MGRGDKKVSYRRKTGARKSALNLGRGENRYQKLHQWSSGENGRNHSSKTGLGGENSAREVGQRIAGGGKNWLRETFKSC